jgi:Na+:H+ antiporter, NhaA family
MLGRGTADETFRIGEILRKETVGGGLLLLGAVVALVWANSPWSGAYTALSGLVVGPHALHLDLTLSAWAADGLLAVFFFVAGLELKREFVAGDLRAPARAALPVARSSPQGFPSPAATGSGPPSRTRSPSAWSSASWWGR